MTRNREIAIGPLAKYEDDFRVYLLSQSYAVLSARNLVGVWKSFDRWLGRFGIGAQEIESIHFDRFVSYRKRKRYIHWNSLKGIKPLIDFMVFRKIFDGYTKQQFSPAFEKLLQDYRNYLTERMEHSSLGDRGRLNFVIVHIHNFLIFNLGNNPDFKKLRLEMVRMYPLELLKTCKPGYVQSQVSELRCFLRWMFFTNRVQEKLYLAFPVVCTKKKEYPEEYQMRFYKSYPRLVTDELEMVDFAI
jgi:hypothetical protein